MEIPDQLFTVYTAEIEEQDGSYVVEVPKREVEVGEIHKGRTYRIGLVGHSKTGDGRQTESSDSPPVEEGEERVVEIESIGDQGDGIAKLDNGYVVIVEDVEVGDRVQVKIENAQENVAFAEAVELLESQETYL
ncbi:TRAM domain-containing protein [Halorubrum trapanicum]|uniref:TRAM domain-containing protein n=1 Tax=Halorubrum trapanicum TaxID=29284 RepID=UPI000BBB5177|nr:TRAM domain-containing protein [Halorubrum trapanicum]